MHQPELWGQGVDGGNGRRADGRAMGAKRRPRSLRVNRQARSVPLCFLPVLYHPDCHRRLLNCTGSVPNHPRGKAAGTGRISRQAVASGVAGFYRRLGFSPYPENRSPVIRRGSSCSRAETSVPGKIWQFLDPAQLRPSDCPPYIGLEPLSGFRQIGQGIESLCAFALRAV